MCQEFRNQVKESAEIAIQEANEKDVAADPGSFTLAEVNGRKSFAKKFKKCADKKGDKYKIGPVKIDPDGYSIHISGLNGTNIQNHKKKSHIFTRFAEQMESKGWDVDLSKKNTAY